MYPALKDTIKMRRVVETDWISHLGCPLYVHPSYPFEELLLYLARVDSGLTGTTYQSIASMSQSQLDRTIQQFLLCIIHM